MVIITSPRGPLKQSDGYYVTEAQAGELAVGLSLREVLVLRQLPWEIGHDIFVVSSAKRRVFWIDLTRSFDSLLMAMTGSTRKEIKRAGQTLGQCEIIHNTSTAQGDFYSLYRQFQVRSDFMKALPVAKFGAFLRAADVWVAYCHGRPVCGHLNLIDDKCARVHGVWSASIWRDCSDPVVVSALNRWLYWREMVAYKEMGISAYDLGGGTPGIIEFKRRLGAAETVAHDYVLARPPIGTLLSLYARLTGRDDERLLAPPGRSSVAIN